jgi:hypothetical protein
MPMVDWGTSRDIVDARALAFPNYVVLFNETTPEAKKPLEIWRVNYDLNPQSMTMQFRSDQASSEVDRTYKYINTDEEWTNYMVAIARDAVTTTIDMLCIMEYVESTQQIRDVVKPIINTTYYPAPHL